MKLSVCIITKEESEQLKRCLASLKKYDMEIVVVDTGSVDKTKHFTAFPFTGYPIIDFTD